MSDFYATSTNNAVEIGKDVYPYKDTGVLKKVVSGTSNFSISAEDLDGITTIRVQAFLNCSKLTSITIPDSVTSIGTEAFGRCGGLTGVAMGNGVTSIGTSAFYGCTKLTTVAIGNGVTSIESQAFNICINLTEITCLAVTPPKIQSNTFLNVPATCIIKVPAQSVEAYKSATNWSERANYIQAI